MRNKTCLGNRSDDTGKITPNSSLLILNFLLAVLLLSCPTKNSEPETDSVIVMDLTDAVTQDGSAVIVPADFAGFCHAGTSNNLDREYGILDEAGTVWVHWDFSWSTIQPTQDIWDFSRFDGYVQRANTEGKKVIGMLLYDVNWVHTLNGNDPTGERRIWPNEIPYFCEYAVETVKRYNGKNGHGKVDAWLIWNEPDLAPRFWTGTQAEFFALTKATAEAIRKLDETEDTHTALIGGVFTSTVSDSWITGLLGYENVKDLLDGVAFHPYSPGPASSAGMFSSFKQKVKPFGFEDKIWLNEMGYPTYSEKGAIPQGRYGTDQWEGDMPRVTVQTFTLLAVAGARNLTWYHLFDNVNRDNADSEDWFGLVWRKSADEWERKGGYWGYALCSKNLPGKICKKLDFPQALPALPKNIQNHYFEGSASDGNRVLIVWNTDPLSEMDIRITLGGSNHKLWDVASGESSDIDNISTHTLYPANTGRKNLIFLTWNTK